MSVRISRCFFLIVFLLTFSVHFLNHTVLDGEHFHGQIQAHHHSQETETSELQVASERANAPLSVSIDAMSHESQAHNHANFYLASQLTGVDYALDTSWTPLFFSQVFLDAYFEPTSKRQAHTVYPTHWLARDLHRPQLASVVLTI